MTFQRPLRSRTDVLKDRSLLKTPLKYLKYYKNNLIFFISLTCNSSPTELENFLTVSDFPKNVLENRNGLKTFGDQSRRSLSYLFLKDAFLTIKVELKS